MPVNQRVYYPIVAAGFARLGTSLLTTGSYRAAKGVQTVGTTTNFALEQVYQLGQLSLYENIENLPEVQITIDKVADGTSLLQHLATPTASGSSLAGRFNDQQCMMGIAFYNITQEAASGTPLVYTQLSGVYLAGINWNIPVEGNITESISLTCRDRLWYTSPSGNPWAPASGRFSGPFTNAESPVLASGGVQRRENVNMSLSRWPRDIPGVNSTGVNVTGSDGQFAAHIQNVTVAVSLGRTDLFELGRRGPYFRYANFPTEVTTSIEITASESGDTKNVFADLDNLNDETIRIVFTDGTRINLGNKNKLSSITTQGGDTGGGNVTITYNYSNFNDYTCTFPETDPAGLAHSF